MRYASLLLSLFIISAGVERAYSQSCPVITVTCPDSDTNPTLTFSANVSGGDPSAKFTFEWTVSAGKIAGGQGTASITVDNARLRSQGLTATVEIGGIPTECGNKASCSLISCPPPVARKFDQYGDLSWAEERARLDQFGVHLEPGTRLSRALPNRKSSHRRATPRSNKRSLLR